MSINALSIKQENYHEQADVFSPVFLSSGRSQHMVTGFINPMKRQDEKGENKSRYGVQRGQKQTKIDSEIESSCWEGAGRREEGWMESRRSSTRMTENLTVWLPFS